MADAHPHLTNHPTDRLGGTTPVIAALRAQIRHLVTFDAVGSPHVPTVLLQGETGTGKGLVARVIHDSGPRAQGAFIEVNCAAIPDTMLEAELFGFEPGAFTDAKRAKAGLFEAASGGTLFLDEVDALPLVLQGKLLTAIESKRIRRLGAVTDRVVDVKLIAAMNAVLSEVLAAGRFRADLYHRLAVVVLTLPPLRQRGDDILVLVQAFLQYYTAAHGIPAKRLSTAAEAWLQAYAWPGNVRELSHVMERVTLLHMGDEVESETLLQLGQALTLPEASIQTMPALHEVANEQPAPAEAEHIRQALAQTGGNVARAARLLGVSRDTIRYRMQRYGIARPRLGEASLAMLPHSLGARAGGAFPQSDAQPPQEANAPPGSGALQDARDGTVFERPEPLWEHKPVAVLALELLWPTTPTVESQSYDPWTEQARWEQAVRDKVQGFGGVLVRRTASLFVWVFGIPQGLEQLPQRAVHSALAIRQMAVDACAPDLPPCPSVRMAVDLATVQVDLHAADPTFQVLGVDETLTLPVRLLGQAEPGAIVVSPEVGRLVDGWVALEERPLPLNATDAAHAAGYTVIRVSPGREAWMVRRRPTRGPLVGRTRELTLLEDIFEQAKAGRGQVVTLVGAPGMGKSRLLTEFRQRVSGERIGYAEGRCLAYGSGTPYLPILDLLREHCGIAADDAPDMLRTKVRASLQQLGLDADANLPYLLHLLGLPVDADQLAQLSAETSKARTCEAIRQLFLTASRHHPVVLAVEDLHWIDPSSEALLASLVDALAGAAMLLLATCRPGYRAPWLDKSYATQMALQPLSPDESRQVVRRVMRATVIPPTLEQQLLTRAEGNPFFLEELTYSVQEQGEGDTTLTVPDTIQAVLAGRMDRLSPPERQLLQAAAVIGKDVAVPLLQTITERPEAALQQELTQLQAAEFLYQARFFPERAYTFKHALTQEVAYGSLLPERRRALHARLVAAIEHLTEDRGDEPIERLARHALQGEVWDKALTYCWQAGEKAMAGSAHREAVGSFEQALSVLPHLPETHDTLEQAVDLRLALRSALRPLGDFGRILTCLREAERLAEALDDRRRLSQVLRYLSSYFYLMDAYDQAIVAAQRALALATTGEEAVLPALANQYLGLTHQARGDYGQAIDCYRQTVALLEGPWRHERCGEAFLPAVFARAALAVCHANLGMFAAGETLGAEGLRIAEAVDNPASLMWAYWGVGLLALRQGDPHKALPWLKRAVRICQDADLPAWFPRMAVALGQAYTLVGRLSDAVPLLAQALELSMARERAQFQILARLSLGETHMLAGRLEEARPLAEGALTLTRARQERSHQAEALRLLGDIAARREPPEPDQAEAFYREALTLADELGLRPLVAHCHRSLGLLHRDTGRLAEAHSELSAAITLYRDMDMTFWLPQTEDALAHL